jgi:hypothetical protein
VSFVMFYIGSGVISVSLLLIVMLVQWLKKGGVNDDIH